MISYLSCWIYRPCWGDCSNHGISSTFDKIALVCDGPNEFDPAVECPANLCMLQVDSVGGQPFPKVVPAMVDEVGTVVPRPGWWMYGGCFVDGDSRFSELCSKLLGYRFIGGVMLCDRSESKRRGK